MDGLGRPIGLIGFLRLIARVGEILQESLQKRHFRVRSPVWQERGAEGHQRNDNTAQNHEFYIDVRHHAEVSAPRVETR